MKEHRTSRTVILVLSFSRGALQLGEEFLDLVPDIFAAGETFPVLANRSDQLVTFVDWRDEIHARVAHAVRQQRFYIWLHLAQIWIVRSERLPCSQRQERLGRARRARIHRGHFSGRRRIKKEREIDRQRERLPLSVADLEIRQRACIARNQLESPVNNVLEAQRARVARANDFPRQRFEQMSMLRRKRNAAQFASFRFDHSPRAGSAGKFPQRL